MPDIRSIQIISQTATSTMMTFQTTPVTVTSFFSVMTCYIAED